MLFVFNLDMRSLNYQRAGKIITKNTAKVNSVGYKPQSAQCHQGLKNRKFI